MADACIGAYNTTDNIQPGKQSKTCMTLRLRKYFEDRTQTDSFDCVSISATLNSTKIAFHFF